MNLTPLKVLWSVTFDRLGVYDRHLRYADDEILWFVPFYHRILRDDERDPFELGLGVQCTRFEKQLAFYRERFHVCTVQDALEILAGDTRPERPLLSITFDDGYLDNVELGLPLLRRHGCPATFFLCTGPIEDGRPFWWDVVIVMAQRGGAPWENLLRKLDLPADRSAAASGPSQALDRLWQLPFDQISDILGDDMIDGEARGVDCPPRMTREHVELLMSSGMDIAAHTHNHSNLTKETDASAREEIVRSKSNLEAWTGRPVTGFATPHGFVDDRIKQYCAEEGIAYIASCDRGVNRGRTHFYLTRIGAPNTHVAHLKRSLALAAAASRRAGSKAIN